MLAAFVAGVAVGALSPRGSALRERIESTGFGLLIPMFFFSVGIGFDLPALLASRETLAAMPALIAAAIGRRLGVLDAGLNAAMILLAVFTAIVSPLLYNLLSPASPSQ